MTPIVNQSTANAAGNLLSRKSLMKRVLLLAPIFAALSGCGVAEAPCRITAAGLDMIPVVGHVLAAPTNACAAAID